MRTFLAALCFYFLPMQAALAWDYHKNVDPEEGTQKWSCVYDADHGQISKQLCIMMQAETSNVGISLSNGMVEICDEVMLTYKVNGGMTFVWQGWPDDDSISLNLEVGEHEMALLLFGSRLVIHSLDSCGNSSLMEFDISGVPPAELFDGSL